MGKRPDCDYYKSSSCSTFCTRRVNHATNQVVSPEWGKDRIVITIKAVHAPHVALVVLIIPQTRW